MKIQIPDKLKEDLPQTAWGKILTATPVIMTVLATMLAGLASSEMTRAQYSRSLAAQQQSKAGDQWSFFQAKRLRGALQRNALDMLETMSAVQAPGSESLKAAFQQMAAKMAKSQGQARERLEQLDASDPAAKEMLQAYLDAAARPANAPDALGKQGLDLLASPAGAQTIACLQKGELPVASARLEFDGVLKQAMQAVEASRPDPEVQALLNGISDKELETALRRARDHVEALDAATQPINQTIEKLEETLTKAHNLAQVPAIERPATASDPGESLLRNFKAARLNYNAVRYEAEARLNQSIANLYELQVRKSNYTAERHHRRSQRFFFGMLGAQAAVIIATFAMAARKRNLLWSLAAFAGIAALIMAIYVYLYV